MIKKFSIRDCVWDCSFEEADERPAIAFPGMPHDVHRALARVLEYAGSLSAAGALLAEYALLVSRK